MIDRRRCPRLARPRVQRPSASGPRWRRAAFIRRTALSSGADSRASTPAMPHMAPQRAPRLEAKYAPWYARRSVVSRLRVMHVVVGGDIGGAERGVVDLAPRPERT